MDTKMFHCYYNNYKSYVVCNQQTSTKLWVSNAFKQTGRQKGASPYAIISIVMVCSDRPLFYHHIPVF